MKAIVFGGAGFIGSAVVRELAQKNHSVVVFDRKRPDNLPKNVTCIQGDILDEATVQNACRGQEIVYNFAGWADLDTGATRPVEVVRQNILGNTIILDAARHNNAKRFVYASSMYVFSKAGSFYRATKQSSELLIEEYQKQYGLPFTVLRYGSLYGPGSTEGNAIHGFIKQALVSGTIAYWGTGDELRQYIHISDAARGAVEIIEPEFENQYIVLTGPEDIRLKDLLAMINEIFGKRLSVQFNIDQSNKSAFHYAITPYSFSPKLGKKLVFRTYTDMGQGLLQCIQDLYQEYHGSEVDPQGLFKVTITKRD